MERRPGKRVTVYAEGTKADARPAKLTAEEERVVRMVHGVRVAPTAPLARVADGSSELADDRNGALSRRAQPRGGERSRAPIAVCRRAGQIENHPRSSPQALISTAPWRHSGGFRSEGLERAGGPRPRRARGDRPHQSLLTC